MSWWVVQIDLAVKHVAWPGPAAASAIGVEHDAVEWWNVIAGVGGGGGWLACLREVVMLGSCMACRARVGGTE